MAQNVQLNVEANANPAIQEFTKLLGTANDVSKALRNFGKDGRDAEEQLAQAVAIGGDAYKKMAEDATAAGKSVKEVAAILKQAARDQKADATDQLALIREQQKAQREAAKEEAALQRDIAAVKEQWAAEERERAQEAAQAQKQALQATREAAQAQEQQTAAINTAAQAVGNLANAIVTSSAGFEQQRMKLQALYHDTDLAQAKFKEFTEYAAQTPFKVSSVVDAAIKIQSMGQDASKLIPIAGDLAARFGVDIPDAAQALGKAMSGSSHGVRTLIESFGVSRDKLRQYGASVNEAGEISLHSSGDIEKLRNAITAMAKSEWAGSMAAQMNTLQGVTSNLDDALEQTKSTMGDQLLPSLKDGVTTITEFTNAMRKNHPEILGLAGTLIGAAEGALALSVAAAAIGPALAIASAAVTGFSLTLTAVLATAVLVNNEIHDMQEASKLLADSVKHDADQLVALGKAHREWAGKGADELHRLGVTTKDVGAAIGGVTQEITLLRDQGVAASDARIQRLQKEIQAYRELGQSLATIEAAERAAAAAAEQAKKDRAENAAAAQSIARSDLAIAKAKLDAQKQALDADAQAGSATLEQRRALVDAKIAYEKQEADAAIRKVRDTMQAEVDGNEASEVKTAAHLREIEALQATSAQKVAALNDEREKLEQEHQARLLKIAGERIAASERIENDSLQLLLARLHLGENVATEVAAARVKLEELARAAEQNRYEQAIADLSKLGGDEAALNAERAKHAENLAHIQAQAELKRYQAAAQVRDAIENLETDLTKKKALELDRQLEAFRKAGASEMEISEYVKAKKIADAKEAADKAKSAQERINALEAGALKDQEAALKKKAEAGEDVTADEIALIQKQAALERANILASKDELVKKYGDAALAQKVLNLELEASKRAEAKNIEEVGAARVKWIDDYVKKLEELKAKYEGGSTFHKGGYSVEEFFKTQGQPLNSRSDEEKNALKSLGLAEDTNLSEMIEKLRNGAQNISVTSQQNQVDQKLLNTVITNAQAAQPSTINVYVNGQQAGGASIPGDVKDGIQQSADNILRALRFGQ